LPAHGDVGDERLALELLVGVGRGVVVLEPVFDVDAVYVWPSAATTGLSIRTQSNAMSFSSSGGSARATRGELGELIVCG
jgi:hypothetical protein